MTLTAGKPRGFAPSSLLREFLLLFLLIALSSPVFAQAPPAVPLTAEETARWQSEGFNAEAGGEWKYYGISPPEAREWIQAGIEFPGWANQWKSEGFRAGEAGRWKELANVYTAAGFLKAGFGPGEAKIWLDSGVKSSLRAGEYRALGLSAETGAAYWQLGIYPEEAGPWFKAGFGPEETLAWRWGPKDVAFYHTAASPYSQVVYHLDEVIAWRDAGFTAEQTHNLRGFQVELAEARAWLAEGFAPSEILGWRDSGFSPAEAGELRDEGFTLEQAEANKFAASWAAGDEIPELAYALELLDNGRLEVLLTMTLINRPGGAYDDEFQLPLPGETTLPYGQDHYRSAGPSYSLKSVEVDGVAADYRHARDILAIPLPADGKSRNVRISYLTDDRVLYFPHHDELSFVAISDNPEVIIRRASVSVRLPLGAEVVFSDGEAGLPVRRDLLARVEEGPPGRRVVFEATRVLREKMNLRVNLAFTKGHVDPGLLGKFKALDLRLNRSLTGLLVFLAALFLSSAYFLRVWQKYGRDSTEWVSLKKSLSPGMLSPAEARQFQTGGRVDGVSLIATIIGLAQKGALKIVESEGRYTLVKEPAGAAKLFPAEAAFLGGLFKEGNVLILSGRPAGRRLKKGLQAMRAVLQESFGNYYRSNLKYFFPGLVLLAIGVVVGVYSLKMDEFGRLDSFRIFYAVALCVAALGQLAFFRFLLKAPSEALLRQRDTLRGYRRYLETDLKLGKDLTGYLTPNQESHLAFSLALGLELGGMAIRRGQARWFSSRSGPFAVGDFASALRPLGRSFRL